MTVPSILAKRLKALDVTKLPPQVYEAVEAHAIATCEAAIEKKITPASISKLFAGVIRQRGFKGADAPLTSSNHEGGQAD